MIFLGEFGLKLKKYYFAKKTTLNGHKGTAKAEIHAPEGA